jgi:hypothetical protein
MSWDQGICLRDELPTKFVAWADAKQGAPLQYITWFGGDPPIILDFGEAGALEAHMGWREFSALLDRLSGKREAA